MTNDPNNVRDLPSHDVMDPAPVRGARPAARSLLTMTFLLYA
jgi:hypothetical protein